MRGAEVAALCKGGGPIGFEILSAVEVTFLIEMVVDGRVGTRMSLRSVVGEEHDRRGFDLAAAFGVARSLPCIKAERPSCICCNGLANKIRLWNAGALAVAARTRS